MRQPAFASAFAFAFASAFAFAFASAFALPAYAACPSYSASSSSNSDNCGFDAVPGANPSVADWQPIFSLVSAGPAAWGASGPTVSMLPSGCASSTDEPATFPCELLKAIAMNESGWTHSCVPTYAALDQVGKSERAHHHLVRSRLRHDAGGHLRHAQGRDAGLRSNKTVAADATYNSATGAQILAGKWRAVKCVGDCQPRVVEDCVHRHLGLQRPRLLQQSQQPRRHRHVPPPVIPTLGCPNRPYQGARVFGWVEHPPTGALAGGGGAGQSQPAATFPMCRRECSWCRICPSPTALAPPTRSIIDRCTSPPARRRRPCRLRLRLPRWSASPEPDDFAGWRMAAASSHRRCRL